MTITKIISGGQTGADQAGLFAASKLGIKTGGFAPKGFLTDEGPKRELLQDKFGLKETTSSGYAQRTYLNIRYADATLIFGDVRSPGSKATEWACLAYSRPHWLIPWETGKAVPDEQHLLAALSQVPRLTCLNIAGNRESVNPGIFIACETFLLKFLSVLNQGATNVKP